MKKNFLKMEENGSPMSNYKKTIVITGGSGRFGIKLKKIRTKYLIFFPKKKELDIIKYKSILKYLKKKKPKIFINIKKILKKKEKKKPKIVIHMAALSRPMDEHYKNLKKSIDINIIGTCNVVKACQKLNIKLVYFSTSYVYPGTRGNYKETDPVLPKNNYSWSKLGGECAVQMYDNSLILRICMTEKPFVHKKAFCDFITNFIYHDDVAKILFKIIHLKGIINLGGKIQSVFKFVRKDNPSIKKSFAKKILGKNYPLNPSMNISKLIRVLK